MSGQQRAAGGAAPHQAGEHHGHLHDDGAGHHSHHSHHDHSHGHHHHLGFKGWLREIFIPHTHDAADSIDDALEASTKGIQALKISLLILLATTVLQFVVVLFSGSVALLADTIHNFSDALTAVPLWIAFVLGRKAASRRYTYGFGRAEDLAGLFIVLGAAGVMLGFPLADPVVGLLISAAIMVLLWGTIRSIGRRLMDGIEPELVDRAQSALEETPGVIAVQRLQLRWNGHRLQGTATILVEDISVSAAQDVMHRADHRLRHALPKLDDMVLTPGTPATGG